MTRHRAASEAAAMRRPCPADGGRMRLGSGPAADATRNVSNLTHPQYRREEMNHAHDENSDKGLDA
jgi:hypothetical protein